MYNAQKIAKYVIWRLQKGDLGCNVISNLKLQKVLYFLQAEFLVSTGNPLFQDNIEAWAIGPVITDVYMRYRIYGSSCLPSNLNIKNPYLPKEIANRIDDLLKEIIPYSSTYLTQIAMKQTPWTKNYRKGEAVVIPNDDIKEFFSEEESVEKSIEKEPHMYKAEDIAEYVIQRLDKGDLGYKGISNLKLQKVLYFLQAEFLVSTGKPLFEDEIVALDFGPAVLHVYFKYRMFGSTSIFCFSKNKPFVAKEDAERIDAVLKEVSSYPVSYLTDVTVHQTPWIKNHKEGKQNVIPNEDILKFFKHEKVES